MTSCVSRSCAAPASKFDVPIDAYPRTRPTPAIASSRRAWRRSRQKAGSSSKSKSDCRSRADSGVPQATRRRLGWRWNARLASSCPGRRGCGKLTAVDPSDRMVELGRMVSSWLSGVPQKKISGGRLSGVPAGGRGRAETLLLDLVRTGIENDFEQVVFPQHPELRDVKGVLERAGAFYASLSGSGSALYGFFRTRAKAVQAADRLRRQGVPAQATTTLPRAKYWKEFQVSSL